MLIYLLQGAMELSPIGAAGRFLAVSSLGVVSSFGLAWLLRRIPGVAAVI